MSLGSYNADTRKSIPILPLPAALGGGEGQNGAGLLRRWQFDVLLLDIL